MRGYSSSRFMQVCHFAVTLALAAVLAIVLVRHVRDRRAQAYATMCYEHLFVLACLLNDYHLHHGTLPPAFVADETGTALYSWRMVGLEEIDKEIWSEYNRSELWTTLKNRRLLDGRGNEYYACPADKKAAKQGNTSYVAVIGEETFWPGRERRRIPEIRPEIDNRILLIEVLNAEHPWTSPRDLSFDEAIALFPLLRESGHRRHPRGLHYVTFGGKVGKLSSIRSVEEFADMLRLPKGTYQDLGPLPTGSAAPEPR